MWREPIGNPPIYGPRAGAANHEGHRERDEQDVIFEAFARLRSRPVHEEAESQVHQRHSDNHLDRDAERRDAPEEAKNEAQAAEEFRADNGVSKSFVVIADTPSFVNC